MRALRGLGQRVTSRIWRLGYASRFFLAILLHSGTSLRRINLTIREIFFTGVLSLIIILVLLSIGRIFNADFGLFFFVPRDTPMLYSTTDVIDTFVYRSLVQLGNISMAAAAGFYQSIVGLVMVVTANWVVRRINEDY